MSRQNPPNGGQGRNENGQNPNPNLPQQIYHQHQELPQQQYGIPSQNGMIQPQGYPQQVQWMPNAAMLREISARGPGKLQLLFSS